MDAIDNNQTSQNQTGIFNFVDVNAGDNRDPNANGTNGSKQWRANYADISAPIAHQYDDSNPANRDQSGLSSPFASLVYSTPFSTAGTPKSVEPPPHSSKQTVPTEQCPLPLTTGQQTTIDKSAVAHSPYAPEILIGGAAVGTSLEIGTWALDNHYAQLSPAERVKMQWWEPHSRMIATQNRFNLAFKEAESLSTNIAKQLEQHAVVLQESSKSLDTLHKKLSAELIEDAAGKREADIVRRQQKYVESMSDKKTYVPELKKNIGTTVQVEAGERIFQKGDQLTKAVSKYEKRLLQAGWTDESLSYFKQDALNHLDSRWKALGSKTLKSEADLVLKHHQKEFLAGVADISDPNLIKSKIGTAADLSTGKAIFLEGSDMAKMLTVHSDAMTLQNSLLLQEKKAAASLLSAKGALAAQIEKGAGSWLGKAAGGGARGLLFAAGAMAFGYLVEQTTAALTPRQEK